MSAEPDPADQITHTVTSPPHPDDQAEDQVNHQEQPGDGEDSDDDGGVSIDVEHVPAKKKRSKKKPKSKRNRGLVRSPSLRWSSH